VLKITEFGGKLILDSPQAEEIEDTEIRAQAAGQANESEHAAHKLAMLEISGTVVARSA
jgi:hypothetical protein